MDTLKKVMEINTWFLLLQTKTKKVLTKYTELSSKINNLIETINDKPGCYEKKIPKNQA